MNMRNIMAYIYFPLEKKISEVMARSSPKNTINKASICIKKEKEKIKTRQNTKKLPEDTQKWKREFFDTHKNISR